jgi:ribose transport system substrate-binding protein
MIIPELFRLLALVLLLPVAVSAGPKVGLLMKDRGLFWTAAAKGAEEVVTASGGTLVVKAPLHASNLGQQLALLSLFGDEKVDVLLIAPLTQEEFVRPLGLLKAKGVRIVVLDTALPEGVGETFVGYNQESMAEAAARVFASFIKEGDEAAMLRANSIERISTREKAFLTALKTLGPDAKIHVDTMAGATKDDDYPQSCLLLERHPNIRIVASMFSAPSMGMINAIKDKGLGGKVHHLGFGSGLPAPAVEALEAGRLDAWVAQQPKLLGKKAAEAGLALLAGKPVSPTNDVEFAIVTPANLKEPAMQALRD